MLSSHLRLDLFPFPLLRLCKRSVHARGTYIRPRYIYPFRNKANFYGDELLAPRPTLKLVDHPLSDVPNCLFNIAAATLHIGGRSSIRKLRTRHSVVTENHLSSKMFSVYILFRRKFRKIACFKHSCIL